MVLYKFWLMNYTVSIDVLYPYIHFDNVFPCPLWFYNYKVDMR